MDNSFLIEIGKQVPALSVLTGVVWLFLRSATILMEKHATSLQDLQIGYVNSLKDIQAQNLESRLQSKEAINENTRVMREMNQSLLSTLALVEKMK